MSYRALAFADWAAGLAFFETKTARELAAAPSDTHSTFCYANAAKKTITCQQIWKVTVLCFGLGFFYSRDGGG